MYEASSFFGRVCDLEFAYVESANLREVDAAVFLHATQQVLFLIVGDLFAVKATSKQGVRVGTVDLRHQVDEEFRLGGIVRRIAVDVEKAEHAVDEIVKGWTEVRCGTFFPPPALEIEP